MKHLVSVVGFCLGLSWAFGDGYLWFSAASASQTAQIYRYNLRTGQIDRTVAPGNWGFVQSRDYNLLAYDGNDLYVGLENDRTLLKVNPYTGAFRSAFGYQMCNCFYGHHWMKDGTFYAGELWRAAPAHHPSSPGILHVSAPNGLPTNVFYAMERPDLQPIGIEWVGDVLLMTTADGLHRVNFPDEPLVFGAVQYALSGVPGGHTLGGLAYDSARDTLYLASADSNGATLWRVQLDHEAQTAHATPVEQLTLKGYPAGRQPTALGWVPARAGDANDDGCVDDADLLQALFAFGNNDPASDLNRDGIVDDADLLEVLFAFGDGCQG
ncbi:MAG: hypothetical protein WHS44_11780 [Fimbriimonadales bacterium]|nr:MAG: hypothetical protein KatS3mg018_2387 [Fimbriimonadales bacterium]